MGEIGIPRREFLYEIQFWEVQRIIRGYRRRDILKFQLLRLNAYMSCFSMRENKMNLKPHEWLPMEFDESDEDASPILSDEEVDDLQNLMQKMNAENSTFEP